MLFVGAMATMKLGRAAKFSSESAAAAIGCAGKTTSDTAARADAAGGILVAELHSLNAGIAGTIEPEKLASRCATMC